MPLKLFGAGTDSGTFEFFTEEINGRARCQPLGLPRRRRTTTSSSRACRASAAASATSASYFDENRDKLKLARSTAATARAAWPRASYPVQKSTYKPLSRPLFIYAKRTLPAQPAVVAFIGYIFKKGSHAPLLLPSRLKEKQAGANCAKRWSGFAVGRRVVRAAGAGRRGDRAACLRLDVPRHARPLAGAKRPDASLPGGAGKGASGSSSSCTARRG